MLIGWVDLPVLDPLRCTGCGDCVLVCPTQCLAVRWRLPVLARPEDCVSCGLCVTICPMQAFQIGQAHPS